MSQSRKNFRKVLEDRKLMPVFIATQNMACPYGHHGFTGRPSMFMLEKTCSPQHDGK